MDWLPPCSSAETNTEETLDVELRSCWCSPRPLSMCCEGDASVGPEVVALGSDEVERGASALSARRNVLGMRPLSPDARDATSASGCRAALLDESAGCCAANDAFTDGIEIFTSEVDDEERFFRCCFRVGLASVRIVGSFEICSFTCCNQTKY